MSKPTVRYTGLENVKGRSSSNYLGNIFDPTNGAGMSSTHTTDSSIQFDNILMTSITPRSINQYSQTRIERLAKSIRDTGNRLINPITVVRASDLDPEGEVINKFISNGVDVSKLEYIIVSGERRYKAYCLLRDQENQKKHELGWVNPFDTITANILTPEEALNEHVFYEESNTQARQLSPEEALRLFEDALKEVDTEEKKYLMLLEMDTAGVDFGGQLPLDQKEALKKFRMPLFCVYWMEKELGISGWNESTVKNYLSVLNKCSREVKDAIYDEKFSLRTAGKITSFDHSVQNELLELWTSGKTDEFKTKIQQLSKIKGKSEKKITAKSAAKNIDRIATAFSKEIASLEKDRKQLSEKDSELVMESINTITSAITSLEALSKQLRKK